MTKEVKMSVAGNQPWATVLTPRGSVALLGFCPSAHARVHMYVCMCAKMWVCVFPRTVFILLTNAVLLFLMLLDSLLRCSFAWLCSSGSVA